MMRKEIMWAVSNGCRNLDSTEGFDDCYSYSKKDCTLDNVYN